MKQQAKEVALPIGRVDGVNTTDVWLLLPGPPLLFEISVVSWYVCVQQRAGERILPIQLEESRQGGLGRLHELLRQVFGSEMYSLAIWKVHSQMRERRRMLVDLVTENPPRCLAATDVASKLKLFYFVSTVLIDAKDACVRSLVYVFTDVLDGFDILTQLQVDVTLECAAEEWTIRHHKSIGNGDNLLSMSFLEAVPAVLR